MTRQFVEITIPVDDLKLMERSMGACIDAFHDSYVFGNAMRGRFHSAEIKHMKHLSKVINSAIRDQKKKEEGNV